MLKRWVALAVAACAMLLFPLPSQAAGSAAVPKSVASSAAVPKTVAKKLFHAWNSADKVAAAKVATPAAVKTIFAYPYRTPDVFAGCSGNVCRFKHTSVTVPGGLNGILMIVSGKKVVKVYESRHVTKPGTVALWLFNAWKGHDRYRGLEVGSVKAVAKLFRARFDPHGVPYTYQGCTAEPHGKACQWSYEGGAMTMHVRGSVIRGYYVHSVTYIAD